jgi:ABC-type nitrate/sulfonate/bicarbonate transport system substrate-binding protein
MYQKETFDDCQGLSMLKARITRNFFWSLGGLGVLLVCFFPWKVSGAEKLATLYSSHSMVYSLPWIAQEAGLFRKYKLDIDHVYIPSSQIAAAALLGGDVEIALAGGVGFVRAYVQGATDLVFIGSFKNILTFSFLAKPEIKKPEDLKGKKIGVTRLGSNGHYFMVHVFRRFGLDPLRDATLIQVGGEPEVLAALVRGSIDVGSLTPVADATAVSQGFHYVVYGPDLRIPYPSANIVTRRSLIGKRPEAIGQFMRVMAEAANILHRDREFVYKVLGKRLGITDRKILDAGHNTEIKIMEQRLDINPEGIQAVLEDIAKIDPRAKTVNPQALIDRRYLDEMEKSGFFDRLWTEKQ